MTWRSALRCALQVVRFYPLVSRRRLVSVVVEEPVEGEKAGAAALHSNCNPVRAVHRSWDWESQGLDTTWPGIKARHIETVDAECAVRPHQDVELVICRQVVGHNGYAAVPHNPADPESRVVDRPIWVPGLPVPDILAFRRVFVAPAGARQLREEVAGEAALAALGSKRARVRITKMAICRLLVYMGSSISFLKDKHIRCKFCSRDNLIRSI